MTSHQIYGVTSRDTPNREMRPRGFSSLISHNLRYLVNDDRRRVGPITEDFIEPRTNYDNLVQISGSADVSERLLLHWGPLVGFLVFYRPIHRTI